MRIGRQFVLILLLETISDMLRLQNQGRDTVGIEIGVGYGCKHRLGEELPD